ncbi:hypothetical protein HF888_13905 [Bermanella marisrubri]|uniref:Uncharacterized protein n=1 Tax=Bermanella marisrubri TaxID=207949 RepID=Q1MZA0_9GAMM|nr:hypothetical protein [Bermanella marisrubri]EAT11366.1 hypothetical protein RED65_13102 [Oceanobacter sp. RED65] [Bermanella marisrubri]QIZ85248.1 hypothetical protein HF888_13905 [Bermanella marisrubri]
MMDNYYNVFTSQSLKFNPQDVTSTPLASEERATLKDKIAKASQQDSSGVRISISNDAKQLSETTSIEKTEKNRVFEPLPGVMVKQESISYLNEYDNMDKRISMVEVLNTDNPPESSSLSKLLQNFEKQDISLTNILSNAGALESNGKDVTISGRVEIGDFRGGDFLFDDNGNIIAQKFTGSIMRESNETQSIYNIVTESGKQIKIELNVKDKINTMGSNGMSRDINISYQSTKELTNEENTAVKTVLNELGEISTQFQGETSINSNQIKELSEALSESNSVIKSFDGNLNFEVGGFQRKINLSSNSENPLSVLTTESGMNEKFESSIVSGSFLKSKMGDISTDSEYKKQNKLVLDITQEKTDIYIPAVSFNNQNADNLDSKYITTFLEE